MNSPATRTLDSRTRPRTNEDKVVGGYSALMKTVRDAGLLHRTKKFYITCFSILMVLFAGSWVGFALLGDSWFQLIIAGILGIVLTQFAFLAHEASHRQVFSSGPANDRAGRFLADAIVGISYAWWMNKHTRHHANPNMIGKDPDIDMDTFSFHEESAASRSGFSGAFARRQGYLFFPLLLLEGVNLHITSFRTVLNRDHKVDRRWLEILLLSGRIGLYLAVVFAFLPIGMGFAFIGVQLAVFGVYMGATFAPNHKGMPILPAGAKVDFLSKQVLTSRNITGGTVMDTFMGGLNYQVEHHLFPSMPRPHLRRAAAIVREYCVNNDIAYTETTLTKSYGIVVRYLNRVGLSARDPFDCPMVQQFRRR